MKATNLIQLSLPLEYPRTELEFWKLENDYTVEDIALMLEVSRTHMWRALKGKTPLMAIGMKRFKHIRRQQEIIRGNPVDKVLLVKELRDYIEGFV